MDTIRNAIGAVWGLVLRNPVRAQYLVQTVVLFGTAFGLKLTPEQIVATFALSAGILAFATEKAVTPVENPALPAGTNVNVITPEGQPDRIATV